jgi:hypothetical protein
MGPGWWFQKGEKKDGALLAAPEQARRGGLAGNKIKKSLMQLS